MTTNIRRKNPVPKDADSNAGPENVGREKARPKKNAERAGVERVTLRIGGMTCAACAARVERRLNRLEGITATVNYATEKATVQTYGVPVESLVEEIERAGYTVAPEIEPARQDNDGQPPARDGISALWMRMVVALFLAVPLGDLSLTLAAMPSWRFTGWQWVLVALALPIAGWCAWPLHRAAWRGARHGSASMDTLVSTGILAATGWSLYTIVFTRSEAGHGIWAALSSPSGAIYLDVAGGVTAFVLAGRLFEARARHAAGAALRSLAALGAKEVSVLDGDGRERLVSVTELQVGDRFVVRPGETVAADGVVVSGRTAVDASTMTGESAPVEIGTGDQVIGGTVNLSGRLVVTATHVGSDTQLAALIDMVERGQTDKAAIQRLADRICAWFVPAVFALAAATFGGWLASGASVETSFGTALAVLIIACPCALGLATPTALLVASGRGAQLGVFIKDQRALESARAIDTVVLDKTGTVTTGRMTVVDLATADGTDRATLLRLAGAVESASEHAVATAITALARAELGALPEAEDFTALSGLGASATVEGRKVLVGSSRLLTLPDSLDELRLTWERSGSTTVIVAADGAILGILATADTVKPSAAEGVAELHRLGLRTLLLTGDNAATAQTVAAEVGISEIIAGVLPAEKAAVIERLQAEGRSVAVVGDGINDAPALARADLGIAVATGTDIARGASDLLLIRDDLLTVPTAIRLARATLTTIRTNLAWAFGYNLAALPLAAAGLLNPLVAGATMAVSSLLVVSNSLRLRSFTPTLHTENTPTFRMGIDSSFLGEKGQSLGRK